MFLEDVDGMSTDGGMVDDTAAPMVPTVDEEEKTETTEEPAA